MGEKKRDSIPNRPADTPAEGFTWIWDQEKGWHEVPMEIRTRNEKPFFEKDTPLLDLPVDVTPPRPHNPN